MEENKAVECIKKESAIKKIYNKGRKGHRMYQKGKKSEVPFLIDLESALHKSRKENKQKMPPRFFIVLCGGKCTLQRLPIKTTCKCCGI